VIRKSFGSETAGPNVVPDAMNKTQMTGNATSANKRIRAARRSDPYAANSVTRGRT